MKTFRFTVPEFPLSEIEKKQAVENKMVEAPFLSAEGTVTAEGLSFINIFQTKGLHRSKAYFFHFLKKRMLMAAYSVAGYYSILAVLFALMGVWDLETLQKIGKQIPLYWMGFVVSSFIWFRKSRREVTELYNRLLIRKQQAEQVGDGDAEVAV